MVISLKTKTRKRMGLHKRSSEVEVVRSSQFWIQAVGPWTRCKQSDSWNFRSKIQISCPFHFSEPGEITSQMHHILPIHSLQLLPKSKPAESLSGKGLTSFSKKLCCLFLSLYRCHAGGAHRFISFKSPASMFRNTYQSGFLSILYSIG